LLCVQIVHTNNNESSSKEKEKNTYFSVNKQKIYEFTKKT